METTNIILHLPWPPTVNNYYSWTKQGVFISTKGRKYRKLVEEYVREQVGLLKLDLPICLRMVLYPPDKRIRDIDNYNKSLLDALTHAKLWADDSLVDQTFIFRGHVLKHGKVVLFIENAGVIIPINQPEIVKQFS